MADQDPSSTDRESTASENLAPNVASGSRQDVKSRAEPSAGMTLQLSALQGKIGELESAMQHGDADEREAAKARRRLLREASRTAADRSLAPEAKVEALLKKVVGAAGELGRLEKELLPLRRKYEVVARERDDARSELSRSAAVRDKLQALCRELQRENRRLLDEGRGMAQREAASRQELVDKFESSVKDITIRLDEQALTHESSLKENSSLRERLKALLEQYELREKHFEKRLHAKDLEVQLAEAHLAQHKEMAAHAQAQQRAALEAAGEASGREEALQRQLQEYAGRFSEFQSSVAKSSEMFETLKNDTQRYSTLIRTLEKDKRALESERAALTQRCDKASVSLLQTLEDNGALKKRLAQQAEESAKMRQVNSRLEGVCRALQAQIKAGAAAAKQQEQAAAVAAGGGEVKDGPAAVAAAGGEVEDGVGAAGGGQQGGASGGEGEAGSANAEGVANAEGADVAPATPKETGSAEQKVDVA